MLSQKYSEDVLSDILIPRDDWRPFPTALTRYAWDALPDAVRQAQIARGEERLNFDWPGVPAVRFFGLCTQWQSLAVRELEFWAAHGAVRSCSGRVRGGQRPIFG